MDFYGASVYVRQTIVQALFDLPSLPREDHFKVKALNLEPHDRLMSLYETSLSVLRGRRRVCEYHLQPLEKGWREGNIFSKEFL